MSALLWLLLGCSGEEFPATTPPPERPPEAPPAPTPPAPATTIWTADNLQNLTPKVPARETVVAAPIPSMKDYEDALAILHKIVEERDAQVENPWALAHGFLALGPSLRIPDGREAIPALFTLFSQPHKVGALTLPGFPAQVGDTPVEPHTDLILKNLSEVGADPSQVVPTPFGERTLADLYRYTLLKTYLVPEKNHSSYKDPNDVPWGLQALATWAPEPELQWIAVDGTPMDLDTVTSFAVNVLDKESQFLVRARASDATFQRTGQRLFSFTCGGSHLLQGASFAVARGFGTPEDRKKIQAQAGLWLWRAPIELNIYAQAMQQHKAHRVRLLVQRMKFTGHFLESMSKLQAYGLYTPDDAQLHQLEAAAQDLTLSVKALEQAGVLKDLNAVKAQDPQLYLDIIGDAAHAVRGLELALGRQKVRW